MVIIGTGGRHIITGGQSHAGKGRITIQHDVIRTYRRTGERTGFIVAVEPGTAVILAQTGWAAEPHVQIHIPRAAGGRNPQVGRPGWHGDAKKLGTALTTGEIRHRNPRGQRRRSRDIGRRHRLVRGHRHGATQARGRIAAAPLTEIRAARRRRRGHRDAGVRGNSRPAVIRGSGIRRTRRAADRHARRSRRMHAQRIGGGGNRRPVGRDHSHGFADEPGIVAKLGMAHRGPLKGSQGRGKQGGGLIPVAPIIVVGHDRVISLSICPVKVPTG